MDTDGPDKTKQEKRERDERTNASKRQIDHEGHHNGKILFVLRPYYFFPLNRMIDRMKERKSSLFSNLIIKSTCHI